MFIRILLVVAFFSTAQVTFGAENSNYLVFVGEKVSLDSVYNGKMPFYSKYLANYRVIGTLLGNYDKKEIEFTAFDHTGEPGFSSYYFSLLKVKHEGDGYTQVGRYSPLFMTKTGQWAGTYDANDYDPNFIKHTKIKPRKIDFAKPVELDIQYLDKKTIKSWYPQPYYRIEGKKAIAVYGNYVWELFQLHQNRIVNTACKCPSK